MTSQSSKNVRHFEPITLEINDAQIVTSIIVKQLIIIIDNKLNFKDDISGLCKKASMQVSMQLDEVSLSQIFRIKKNWL